MREPSAWTARTCAGPRHSECQAQIRRYVKAYTAGGGTVILTSHETGELSMCTRMWALKDGKLLPVEKNLSEEALIRYL